MSRKQLARSGGDLSRLGTDDTGATMLHLDMDSFFVSVELLFLPGTYAPCPTCHGARYNAETLEVTLTDRSIAAHSLEISAAARPSA